MNNILTKQLKRSLLISVGLVSLASYLFTWLLDRSREDLHPALILVPAIASMMLGLVVFLAAIRAARHPVGWVAPVFSLFGLLVFALLSVVLLRPDLLPHHTVYDFIENRKVTERLVDPDLMNVFNWVIQDKERRVLFVHPSEKGSTALTYPVKIQPGMVFRAYLAMAPEVWTKEGDGVIFSLLVEDQAGIHIIFSRYIDPKHNEPDRTWQPVEVDLSPFAGKLVRLLLVVNSGPADDTRYDWAGWGDPRLDQPDLLQSR